MKDKNKFLLKLKYIYFTTYSKIKLIYSFKQNQAIKKTEFTKYFISNLHWLQYLVKISDQPDLLDKVDPISIMTLLLSYSPELVTLLIDQLGLVQTIMLTHNFSAYEIIKLLNQIDIKDMMFLYLKGDAMIFQKLLWQLDPKDFLMVIYHLDPMYFVNLLSKLDLKSLEKLSQLIEPIHLPKLLNSINDVKNLLNVYQTMIAHSRSMLYLDPYEIWIIITKGTPNISIISMVDILKGWNIFKTNTEDIFKSHKETSSTRKEEVVKIKDDKVWIKTEKGWEKLKAIMWKKKNAARVKKEKEWVKKLKEMVSRIIQEDWTRKEEQLNLKKGLLKFKKHFSRFKQQWLNQKKKEICVEAANAALSKYKKLLAKHPKKPIYKLTIINNNMWERHSQVETSYTVIIPCKTTDPDDFPFRTERVILYKSGQKQVIKRSPSRLSFMIWFLSRHFWKQVLKTHIANKKKKDKKD